MSDPTGWDARYAGTGLLWSASPNRWVAEELADLTPGRALDLGTGEGRHALWLARAGWSVVAVDFSAVALERGRSIAAAEPGLAGRIRWVEADLHHFTPEPQGFDLVVLVYLQLPSGERVGLLRQAASGLAPGGSLLVVGHATRNAIEGVGGPSDPALLFEPADIVTELGGTGLEVEVAEERERPVDGSDRPAIDTVVRARRPGPATLRSVATEGDSHEA